MTASEKEAWANVCCKYDCYEFKERPLLFLKLPHLSPAQKINLIGWLDLMYGNTFQETPDWALEFQVLVRNLVHDDALLFNPAYLDLQEIINDEELKDIMSPIQHQLYAKAVMLSEQDYQEIAAEIEN